MESSQADNNECVKAVEEVDNQKDWDDEEGVEDMIEDTEELEKEDCTDDRDCVTMLAEIMDHLVAAPMVEDQATPWHRPALSNILAKVERISPPSKKDTSVMSLPSSSHALSDSSSDKSEEQYHCRSPKSKTFDMSQQEAELYFPEQASVSDTSQSGPEEQDWDDEEGVEDMIEDIEELEKEDCTYDRDCVTMLEEILDHLVAAPIVEDQATLWLRPALSNILAKVERISPPSKTDTSVMSLPSSSHALSDSSSDKIEEQYHCRSPKSKTFDMRQQAAELYFPEQASVSDTSQSDPEEQVHHTGFDHGYCKCGTRCFTTMQ
ncbi:hypothetical protein MRX96_003141 [Rhipicephalus microplus]